MDDTLTFNILFNEGGHTLSALVELTNPKSESSWYFTNNDTNVDWNGKHYRSVPISYTLPSSQDGVPTNGTLEIFIDIQDETGEELLKWFDTADDKVGANVTAIIIDDGNIREIGRFTHQHGTASWDGRKITWNIGWDDRLNMQINPWSFSANALIA